MATPRSSRSTRATTKAGARAKRNTRTRGRGGSSGLSRGRGTSVGSSELGIEIGGIALLALAAIALVSLVAGPAGFIGGALAHILMTVFGRGAYAIPVFFIITGILMLWRRTGYIPSIRLAGLAALSVAAMVGFELAENGRAGLSLGFLDYVYSAGTAGGGVMGAALTWGSLRLLGSAGSIIVVTAMGVAGLSVAINVPVSVSAGWMARGIWLGMCFVGRGIRLGFEGMVMFLFEGKERPSRGGDRQADSAEHAESGLPSDGRPRRAGVPDGGHDASGAATADSNSAAPAKSLAKGLHMESGASSEQTMSRYSPAGAVRSAAAETASALPDRTPTACRTREGATSSDPIDQPARQLKLIDDSAVVALPSISLLRPPVRRKSRVEAVDPDELSRFLEDTLASFGVEANVVAVSKGPMVTRFEVQPGVGVKVSRIVNLADDLALAFASAGVRIEAPIPGKAAIGIEVPNKEKSMVVLREVIESCEFQRSESHLTIALGKDIAGASVVADLADILHLLVAGATGSGKSVCLNAIICSLLFKAAPDQVKFLMIDPKRVELSVYDGIPHLLAPVVTDTKKAAGFLRWVVEEMENRYRLFQLAGARNIGQYNDMVRKGTLEQFMPDGDDDSAASGAVAGDGDEGSAEAVGSAGSSAGRSGAPQPKPLPFIVVIVDELADLMMVAQNEVEDAIARLAFMARAAGIHLIIATQRPSVDVVTGIIKANIPSRIAFAVSSQVDSRIILDTSGAERLLGKGDMLFHPVGLPKPVRVQGAYISDAEVGALVDYLKASGRPTYQAESLGTSVDKAEGIAQDDDLFEEAARLVVQTGEASISKVQRRFRVGYARAARLIDTMELWGIVGPYEGSRPRKVLMNEHELEEALERLS